MTSSKQDELRGECSGSKAPRQPSGSADPGASFPSKTTQWTRIEVLDMKPTKSLSKLKALRREVADIARTAGDYLQSRSFWRARARVAESELAFALDDLETLRNYEKGWKLTTSGQVAQARLESEGLREDISRIKAEREADAEGYKQDIGALEARVKELETSEACGEAALRDVDEIRGKQRAEITRLLNDVSALTDRRFELAAENEKLKAQVAELSSQLVVNKPVPFTDQGARAELHRLLLQGSKPASWWAKEVKRIRDLLGGEP